MQKYTIPKVKSEITSDPLMLQLTYGDNLHVGIIHTCTKCSTIQKGGTATHCFEVERFDDSELYFLAVPVSGQRIEITTSEVDPMSALRTLEHTYAVDFAGSSLMRIALLNPHRGYEVIVEARD
jgi:hypothetical protein